MSDASNEPMAMWTVYDKPLDYPHSFVARKWLIHPGNPQPTPACIVGPTLAAVRAQLPPGLFCTPRNPEDDPKIVEVWI